MDRDEGAERGQNIGNEENQPIKAVAAARRYLDGRLDKQLGSPRRQLHQ
jgi:hypothetical protein